MAEVVTEELECWEWLAKVTERLTFLRLKVLDHKDITEDDNELLRAMFKVWHNGEYPIFAIKSAVSTEKARQSDLFSEEDRQEVLTELNGKVIELMDSEPIKEDRDDDKKI